MLAVKRSRPTNEKLDHGGLPLVLSQTFRAIIHSRMRGGFENYRTRYPSADVMLFEPDREDAPFFANIFSYRQRKATCALAYDKTRRDLALRAAALEPVLTRHGVTLLHDRLADGTRQVGDAVRDPRPLHTSLGDRTNVRRTARNLERALDALERYLVGA